MLIGGSTFYYCFSETLSIVPLWLRIVLSCMFVLFVVAGDLFNSLLKRICNIKNSSNLLPGHGGFLDRFSSMLFGIFYVWILSVLFLPFSCPYCEENMKGQKQSLIFFRRRELNFKMQECKCHNK
jgi:CDP-diglyceride synthetase